MSKLIVDLVERDRMIGWIQLDDGAEIDLFGRKEDGQWNVSGGDSDQYRGAGAHPRTALARFARACGAPSGTMEVCHEFSDNRTRRYAF